MPGYMPGIPKSPFHRKIVLKSASGIIFYDIDHNLNKHLFLSGEKEEKTHSILSNQRS